jgi:Ni,Fe-hydrogenase maturation factor
METNQVTERLQEEAKSNPVFNAIAYKMAVRERARKIVTVQALKASMEKEGYTFKTEDYQNSLSFLAKLGFGSLKLDKKDRVIALDNIKIKLQDIGKVAITNEKSLATYRQKEKYKTLMSDASEKPIIPRKEDLFYEVALTVKIHGQKVTFAGPLSVTPQQLGSLLIKFNELIEGLK